MPCAITPDIAKPISFAPYLHWMPCKPAMPMGFCVGHFASRKIVRDLSVEVLTLPSLRRMTTPDFLASQRSTTLVPSRNMTKTFEPLWNSVCIFLAMIRPCIALGAAVVQDDVYGGGEVHAESCRDVDHAGTSAKNSIAQRGILGAPGKVGPWPYRVSVNYHYLSPGGAM